MLLGSVTERRLRALDGEMLALMVFALAFGAALRHPAGGESSRNGFVRLMDDVFDACMRIIGWAMVIAPLAVFAIVFNTARSSSATEYSFT